MIFKNSNIADKEEKKTKKTATYTYDSNNNRKEMRGGNQVTAYKYNKNDELLRTDTLNTDTEEEVFCYKRTDLEWPVVDVIKIDKDYIYCQDYIIPRAGGKMHRTNAYSPFSFNEK